MSKRTPCILYILKVPFLLIKFLLYTVGVITYFPIYTISFIFQKFVFNPKFETSQAFYVIFCIPRAILSLGAFAVALGELYLLYWIIADVITISDLTPLIITLVSCIGFTAFSFRFGYKAIYNKFKFPKIKGVKQHLQITWYGIQDLASGFFTILTLLMISHAKTIFCYKFAEKERKYLAFSFRLFRLSLVDVFCFFFWIILFILHWRFPHARRVVKTKVSEEKVQKFVVKQAIHAIFEILFIPLFLIALFNPFLKGRRLLSHMSTFSLPAWKRLIFEEFISTILDLLPFASFLLPLCSLYELPLSLTLYAKTLQLTKPIELSPQDLEALSKIDDSKQQKSLSIKAVNHNKSQDSKTRCLYFGLAAVLFADIIIFISYILIGVSVYRYLIFRRKIQTKRQELTQTQQPLPENIILNYLEYRSHLSKVFTLERTSFSKYPRLVIAEAFNLIVDLPILAISPILLFAPWRLRMLLRALSLEWKHLKLKDPLRKPNFSIRCFALECVLRTLVDYVCFMCILICLIGVWRWPYFMQSMKTLLTHNLESLAKLKGKPVTSKFDLLSTLVFSCTFEVVIDLMFSPLFILCTPFYLICFWRIGLLYRCLKLCKVNEFGTHRFLVLEIGFYAFRDFLCFFPLLLVAITIYRISDASKIIRLYKKEKEAEMDLHKEKNSLREVHILVMANDTQANNPENVDVPPPVKIQKEEEKPLTSKELIKREKDIFLFYACNRSAAFIIADIFSVIPLILTFMHPASASWFLEERRTLKLKKRQADKVELYGRAEEQLIVLRFKSGLYAFVLYMVTIGLLILAVLLIWRSPTLLILMRSDKLAELHFKTTKANEKVRKEALENGSERFKRLVLYCFGQWIRDIPYIPVFLFAFLITPWRTAPVFKQIYRYDDTIAPQIQINEQRARLLKQAKQGLGDLIAFMKLIIVLAMAVRIPFLILLITKNRFPNSKIAKKWFWSEYGKIENDKKFECKLSLKRCVGIAFYELMKDLPVLPFGLLLLIIAPWRVFSIYYILASQKDRIPTLDTRFKKRAIASRRFEIIKLLLVVIRLDLLYFFRTVSMMLSIIKIPVILRIMIHYVMNLDKYQRGDLSYIREINIEYQKSRNSRIKMLSWLVIVLLFFRLASAIRRYKRWRKTYKAQKKELRYKQHEIDEKTKEKLLSFNDITWDTYGKITQYLQVQDLGRLSQVNKKFYTLNKKDFYWEYQFKRDWSAHPSINEDITYREKCISAYKQKQAEKVKQALTEEQRDNLYGPTYFLYEEAVKSVQSLPQILLLPAKLITFCLWHTFGKCFNLTTFPLPIPSRSSSFSDLYRLEKINQNVFGLDYPKLAMTNNFRAMHEGLFSWIFFLLWRYVADVGFIISFICCFLIRISNAGQTLEMVIQRDTNGSEHLIVRRRGDHEGPLVQIQNRGARYLFYVLQLIFLILIIGIIAGSFAVFPFLLIHYVKWKWYQGLLGPGCLLLIHYIAVLNIIMTTIEYQSNAVRFYYPYRAITEIFVFMGYLCKKSWKHVGKPLYDQLAAGIKFICKCSADAIKLLYKGLKVVVEKVWKAIKKVVVGIFSGYVKILANVTKLTLKCGCMGDVLLTPFTLIWMFWPLIIPIFFENRIYFVPAGVVSLILLVVGYKTITDITKQR